MKEFELSGNMRQAWEFIENTNTSVFLTGKAGTGKTTFLRYVTAHTSKTCIVTAPTGVAAINAGGVTLHSFFQLPLAPYVPGAFIKTNFRFSKQKLRIIRALDLLIIDEISMVRADLLDSVDASLRRLRGNNLPFGGVQLLLIGDLQQLAPVVNQNDKVLLNDHYDTAYFFGSRALAKIPYVTVGLTQVFRQQDSTFLQLLNHVRSNNLTDADRRLLASRVQPHFEAEGYIRLTTHNRLADSHNIHRLEALPGKKFTFSATIKGEFPLSSFPTEQQLVLKEGAQVMFIKNDSSPDHLFYNGKIGRVVKIDSQRVRVQCLDDGVPVDVSPMVWENARYEVNEDSNAIETIVEGTFSQLPLRLAWAITIHKSQGLTFNHAIIDAGQAFAPGQVYVALSRCRTLQGLVLATPLQKRSVMSDTEVLEYITRQVRACDSASERLRELRQGYFRTLLLELFDFRTIGEFLYRLQKLAAERMGKGGAAVASIINDISKDMQESISDVAMRWRITLEQLDADLLTSEKIQLKTHNAIKYFLDKLQNELITPLRPLSRVKPGNKVVAKSWNELYAEFNIACESKRLILETMLSHPFSTEAYLTARRDAVLLASASKKARKINVRAKNKQ